VCVCVCLIVAVLLARVELLLLRHSFPHPVKRVLGSLGFTVKCVHCRFLVPIEVGNECVEGIDDLRGLVGVAPREEAVPEGGRVLNHLVVEHCVCGVCNVWCVM
jgi:hypothetical protein